MTITSAISLPQKEEESMREKACQVHKNGPSGKRVPGQFAREKTVSREAAKNAKKDKSGKNIQSAE